VGRHNALDKLIGALLRTKTGAAEGFVLISSRASYELVAKCAAASIGALASISAPTARAVRTAQECNIALWGFVRQNKATRYA
jgi:FdhD protein